MIDPGGLSANTVINAVAVPGQTGVTTQIQCGSPLITEPQAALGGRAYFQLPSGYTCVQGVTTVADALLGAPGVAAVHHLYVWSLASDVPALSAHVVLEGEQTLHDAQAAGGRLKDLLEHRFGITHATLELECHPCDDPQAL